MTPFIGVEDMARLVNAVGLERFLRDLAGVIEEDFRRWSDFAKWPRLASHSDAGVIELMPTCDDALYAFKYVNGHPGNTRVGLQTVTAFGVLSSADTGYPLLLSEMTLATALRTAATSALAARHLARADSSCMAIVGLGAQAEFQAIAFRELLGIRRLQVFDVDPGAVRKFARNMAARGIPIVIASDTEEAACGADVITTITADKRRATVIADATVAAGVHVNAVGGDCPGKTELEPALLRRADVFVEYGPQTRIEGEIQQMPPDFPVTELWRVIGGEATGRETRDRITVFDSVGFAIEDFSVLRYVHDLARVHGVRHHVDLVATLADPKDLFGLLAASPARAEPVRA